MAVISPGDRVMVYQQLSVLTPSMSTDEICLLSTNPWVAPLDPTRPKYRCWGDWVIVVLRRQRKDGEVWLTVTSNEFPEPLRSRGVRVPLTHVELVEVGYGLPERAISPVASKPEVTAQQVVVQQKVLF